MTKFLQDKIADLKLYLTFYIARVKEFLAGYGIN